MMAKHPRPRATCATCGKRVAVHADSTLWPHTEGYKPWRGLCPGSEHHPDWQEDEDEMSNETIIVQDRAR